jgi:hypothetical protein
MIDIDQRCHELSMVYVHQALSFQQQVLTPEEIMGLYLEAYTYVSNVIGGGKKSFLSDEQ